MSLDQLGEDDEAEVGGWPWVQRSAHFYYGHVGEAKLTADAKSRLPLCCSVKGKVLPRLLDHGSNGAARNVIHLA